VLLFISIFASTLVRAAKIAATSSALTTQPRCTLIFVYETTHTRPSVYSSQTLLLVKTLQ